MGEQHHIVVKIVDPFADPIEDLGPQIVVVSIVTRLPHAEERQTHHDLPRDE